MDFESLNKQYINDISKYIVKIKNLLGLKGYDNFETKIDKYQNTYDITYIITTDIANYINNNNLLNDLEQKLKNIRSNIFCIHDKFNCMDFKVSINNNKIYVQTDILEFPEEDDSKIIKYIKHNNEGEDKIDTYKNIIESYTDISWKSSKTFNDLQTLNLLFIQGYLSATPSHFGILDPESNIIGTELYNINKFDYLTTNSQPYDKFPGWMPEDRGKNIIQTPFIEGIYHRNKINTFIKLLKQINKNIAISHLNTKTMVKNIYNPKNIEHNDLQDRYANYTVEQFGLNNINLIKNGFDYLIIYCDEHNNNIFTQITEILKSLL